MLEKIRTVCAVLSLIVSLTTLVVSITGLILLLRFHGAL